MPTTDSQTGNEPTTIDIRPGDIIAIPRGVRRDIERVTVHSVHRYPTGDLSIRYRYTENPRGIDWSGFIDREDPDVRLLSRGAAAVDLSTRSMLS